MTYVKRFKTMYMHTIDGKPATFDGKDYIYFVGGRNKAMLVPTLAQLRREQLLDIDAKVRDGGPFTAVRREAYSYVLVEVPL